jgi:hypothetical protein
MHAYYTLYKEESGHEWVPILINTIQRNATIKDPPHELVWWKTVYYTTFFTQISTCINPAAELRIILGPSAQISISLSYFPFHVLKARTQNKKQNIFPHIISMTQRFMFFFLC